jgi:hypothetical protein
MKGNNTDGTSMQTNFDGPIPQINTKLLKSFDSVGSAGQNTNHKRYKSSGGSSNLSSFSNESKIILKGLTL